MNRWQHAGYSAPVEGFCSRPSKMVRVLGPGVIEHHLARCGSARPSRCEPCAELKRKDVAAVGRSGWIDSPGDRAYFVTLTAPGADVLPWDRSKCSHSSGVRCSGDIGCRSDATALARWHATVGQRWSWFITELRRELGVEVEFFKTWELQARGAMHAHSMMRTVGVCSDARFRAAVKMAASRWGFGTQVDVQPFSLSDSLQAARKAGYCAKYASKGADALPAVRRIDSNGVITNGGYRSWSASRRWGDTMTAIKLRRCQWATVRAALGQGDAGGGSSVDDAGGVLDLNQGIYAGATTELVDQWIDSLL